MILLISSSCVACWQCFCRSDYALSVQLQCFRRVSGAEKAKEITEHKRELVLSWDKIYVGLQREGSVLYTRKDSNLGIM